MENSFNKIHSCSHFYNLLELSVLFELKFAKHYNGPFSSTIPIYGNMHPDIYQPSASAGPYHKVFKCKTGRESQSYKKCKQDKLVEEKKKLEARRKKLEEEFERKRTISNDKALKDLKNSRASSENKENVAENQVNIEEQVKEKIRIPKWSNSRGRKLDPIFHPCRNVYAGAKSRKLSPLPEGNGNGMELVPILAKGRAPIKITLDTTDVTNEKKSSSYTSLWNRQGSAYLRELTQQMSTKRQQLKEQETEEMENIRRHFSTWNGLWGRPGHGAPRSAFKKQRLDRLLYPQMVPIGVH